MATEEYKRYQKEKKEHINLLRERYYYLQEEITYQRANGTFYRILSPTEELQRQANDILRTMKAING